MTGDDDSSGDAEPAWHERPSTLAGVSVAALIVLGILFWGVSCVAQQVNDPAPAPQYYLDPSTSGGGTSASSSSTTTTTETITSTSPPVTTDIEPGDTSATTPTTTSSTDTTTSFNPSNLPRTRAPTTYDDGRTRPRFNETRTGYPRP
ncbi:MAG: hypothetical protein QOI01_3090 [Mycobacterium sp.]|nr:hypothetical protein [Mycobacterium sp.]